MRFSLLAAAALSLMTAPVLVQAKDRLMAEGHPVLFKCALKDQGTNGWIPEEVLILDDGAGGFLALDPIGYHFAQRPLEAKLAVDNKVRRTFSYSITNSTTSTNQYTEMAYRLTIPKDGSQALITGKPLGYVNDYQGYGRCQSF